MRDIEPSNTGQCDVIIAERKWLWMLVKIDQKRNMEVTEAPEKDLESG